MIKKQLRIILGYTSNIGLIKSQVLVIREKVPEQGRFAGLPGSRQYDNGKTLGKTTQFSFNRSVYVSLHSDIIKIKACIFK